MHRGFPCGFAAAAAAAAAFSSAKCDLPTDLQCQAPRETKKDWSSSVRLPPSENGRAKKLFDGQTMSGWRGKLGQHWNAKDGCIIGTSTGGSPSSHPAASTYCLTDTSHHRNFRLLLEAKVCGGATVHTGIAILGREYTYKGETHSYQGHLVMVQDARLEPPSADWGLFELYRRGWPSGSVSGAWCPDSSVDVSGAASSSLPPGALNPTSRQDPGPSGTTALAASAHTDGWHRLEILVTGGNRIRVALNGYCLQDYTDPDLLGGTSAPAAAAAADAGTPHVTADGREASESSTSVSLPGGGAGPIGLQLHWIAPPFNDHSVMCEDQEVRFRGLILVDDPAPQAELMTVRTAQRLAIVA